MRRGKSIIIGNWDAETSAAFPHPAILLFVVGIDIALVGFLDQQQLTHGDEGIGDSAEAGQDVGPGGVGDHGNTGSCTADRCDDGDDGHDLNDLMLAHLDSPLTGVRNKKKRCPKAALEKYSN